MKQTFHLALHCIDKNTTKQFYKNILGCSIGRQGQNWVDINLYGNQVSFTESYDIILHNHTYKLENHDLPIFHFGVILESTLWSFLYNELYEKGVEVSIEKDFFENKTGAHTSFFVKDPNGYCIEFKCFMNPSEIFRPFKTDEVSN